MSNFLPATFKVTWNGPIPGANEIDFRWLRSHSLSDQWATGNKEWDTRSHLFITYGTEVVWCSEHVLEGGLTVTSIHNDGQDFWLTMSQLRKKFEHIMETAELLHKGKPIPLHPNGEKNDTVTLNSRDLYTLQHHPQYLERTAVYEVVLEAINDYDKCRIKVSKFAATEQAT